MRNVWSVRRNCRARLGEHAAGVEMIAGAQHMASSVVQANGELSVTMLDAGDPGSFRACSALAPYGDLPGDEHPDMLRLNYALKLAARGSSSTARIAWQPSDSRNTVPRFSPENRRANQAIVTLVKRMQLSTRVGSRWSNLSS